MGPRRRVVRVGARSLAERLVRSNRFAQGACTILAKGLNAAHVSTSTSCTWLSNARETASNASLRERSHHRLIARLRVARGGNAS